MQMLEQRKPVFIVMQPVRSDIAKNRSLFRYINGLLDPSMEKF